MSCEKIVVLTTYGHEKVIDSVSVSLFDVPESRESSKQSNALNYCETINSLELKDDKWIFACIADENKPHYAYDLFPGSAFKEILACLDDRSVQRVLRELDTNYLAKALKYTDDEIKEKVFRNMSKRATEMIKEDMEFMGPLRKSDIKDAQSAIVKIIRLLADLGEIIINTPEPKFFKEEGV